MPMEAWIGIGGCLVSAVGFAIHTTWQLGQIKGSLDRDLAQLHGVTMDHGMFWLCTYLGHAKISDTYWYLTGAPELMAVVGEKFDRFAQGGGAS